MNNLRIFKCDKCGKMVVLLPNTHDCQTICCGEPMKELKANSVDAALEKHVPAVEVVGNKVNVQVGSVMHPMLDNHYISFIILVTDKETRRVNLLPGQTPVHTFTLSEDEKPLAVYEYCNLHGLWVKEL